jgi:uncharacterized delta-60 repeat protein
MSIFKKIKTKSGQSLVEVLIATAVGIIFVLGTTIIANFALKSRQDSEKNQVLASLSKELLDNVKIFADANWHNIDTLATTSANHYYLNTSTSSFTAVSGEQNIVISSTTYTRYFYLDDVYRDGSGQIVESGGTLDPSTKKVTVVYGIQGSTPKSISIYVTRSKNNVFVQTDWSGGSGQTGPITSSNEKFETSGNLKIDEKGRISLNLVTQNNVYLKAIEGYNYRIYSISQTSDGGYIAGGYTSSDEAGSYDVFIVKLNSSGNIEWSKTIGGSNNDYINSISQTPDGGYIAGGSTQSYGAGLTDGFIIKLNSSGNIEWSKTIGGSSDDYISSISKTSDGGYIAGGNTTSYGAGTSDALIIKLNSSGNIEWSKAIGGSSSDYIYPISQTPDGGYIAGGNTTSYGAGLTDFFIIKLNSSGNIEWSKTIGGSNFDEFSFMSQTSDGGYIVGGRTLSYGAGSRDAFIIKLNSSGNIEWSKAIGSSNSEYIYSISQTSDGGYIAGGYIYSSGTASYYAFIIKLNSSGNIEWSKEIGDSNNYYIYSISQTSDGGYIAGGWTGSYFGTGSANAFIIKLDSYGNTLDCTNIQAINPSSASPTPTVTSPSPTVTSPSPTVTSPSPSSTSPSPQESNACQM